MTDDKLVNLSLLLYQCLSSSDDTFKPSHYMAKYSSLSTNLQRVNFVFNDIQKHNLFPKIVKDEKNDAKAVEYREKGNNWFRVEKYKKALEEYTNSVATAKSDTVMALAYANRSACLYKLGLYKNCITDIELAFAHNYPKELEKKLKARLDKAQKHQKNVEGYYEKIPTIPYRDKNHKIQCARNCVKIASNEQFGRYVEATEDIAIGEEISIEKPFVCVVMSERLTHCHGCMELCYNLIPCDNCTQALFCSEACKIQAESFHKYECPLLLLITEFDMINSIWLAFRVAILARKDYDSDAYKEIRDLFTPKKKLSNSDSFHRAILVSILLYSLRNTSDFFENERIEDGFKEVMLHQIQICVSNGVNIYEYAKVNGHFERSHFAGGLYPFFSLFNHSCCPNIEGSFYGSTMVLRAINTIKKGQQCFINYDCHYGTARTAARQEFLKKNFFFSCKCRACENDWEPVLVDFQLDNVTIADVEEKLLQADVNFAKKIVKSLIEELGKCEQSEPSGKALTLKKMIGLCFITLGNKRRLQD